MRVAVPGRRAGSVAVRRAALATLAVLVIAAVWITWHAHGGYALQDRDSILASASAQHWAGTDDLGRDSAVRLALALLIGLSGAIAASALATLLAVGVGVLAGFAPRNAGKALIYASDLFLTLPWLFLLMIVRSALPLTMPPAVSAAVTFLLLAVLGWPAFARINFARTLAVRHAEWMLHGRAAGLRPLQLARTHVLPHLKPLVLSQFLVYLPVCVIAEANLGTLGLGISQPLPSWGSMLQSLQSAALLSSSRLLYLPLIALVVVLLLMELLAFEEER